MAENDAFLDGYGGYELELASGEVIHCEPLTLKTAARYMKLLDRAEKGDSDAMLEILDTFPAAVGAEEQFAEAEITPAEFFDSVRRFMALRRPSKKTETPWPLETETTTGPNEESEKRDSRESRPDSTT